MRWALVFLMACAGAASRPAVLQQGAPLEDVVASGEVRRYPVHLDAGRVLRVTVMQRGVDVVVTVFSPTGDKVVTVDGPNGTSGPEHVTVAAKQAGTYTIEVRPEPGAGAFAVGSSGRYTVSLDGITTAEEEAARSAREASELARFWADRAADVKAFTTWTEGAAFQLDDVDAVRRLVGDAHIVAFGEADHLVHEYLAARNALFELLVEHLGFSVYVGETGVPEAFVADDFINGIGHATANEAGAALFSWAMPFALPENVELVEWMRAYNTRPTTSRKLHIYGMDLAGSRDGTIRNARIAVDAAVSYLAAVRPDLATRARDAFGSLADDLDEARYLDLSPAQRDRLTSAVATLVSILETNRVSLLDASPPEAYERAYRSATVAVHVDAFLRDTVSVSTRDNLADPSRGGTRDAAMATALSAIADLHAGDRIFVFAHNNHVRRGPILHWGGTFAMPTSFGQHAAKLFGEHLVVIGTTHGDGKDTATFDALAHRAGKPRYALDLRSAPTPELRSLLARRWDFRRDDLAALDIVPLQTEVPSACFDVVAYFESITHIE